MNFVRLMHFQNNLHNKRQRTPKGQSKMENLEKLATYDTQDEETQNKNTTQYVMETTMGKQSQIKYARKIGKPNN